MDGSFVVRDVSMDTVVPGTIAELAVVFRDEIFVYSIVENDERKFFCRERGGEEGFMIQRQLILLWHVTYPRTGFGRRRV